MFADKYVIAAILPDRPIDSLIDSVSNETPPFEHETVVIQTMAIRIDSEFFTIFYLKKSRTLYFEVKSF